MSFIVHRVAKQAARYTPGGGREKCGLCRFFVAPVSCGKVIGPVSAMGWCKYYSRQMVQQFGGSTVAGGGATFDQSFMSGSLGAGAVFTRASTGTYYNASGTLVSAAINAPRFDYDPATLQLKGLLLEEARTNLVLQSGNLANAAWTPINVGAPAAPAVTANQTAAPDGTLTAARIVYPAVSAVNTASVVYQAVTATAASHAFSVWLKGNAGGEQLYLYTTKDTSSFHEQRVTLTTAWQRFVVVTGVLSAGSWLFLIGTDLRDPAQTGTPAQTVYVWGAQVEQGAFATSYIPTTVATATRSQDIMTMPLAGWFSATAGTVMADVMLPANGNVGYRGIFVLDGGPFNVWLRAYITGGTSNVDGSLDVASIGFGISTPGTPFKIAATYSATGTHTAFNGAMGTGTAAVSTPATWTTLRLGVTDSSNANPANGYLRRVTYWPRVLSDAEMQSVTL